jgi:hypothetical protein
MPGPKRVRYARGLGGRSRVDPDGSLTDARLFAAGQEAWRWTIMMTIMIMYILLPAG